MKIALITGAGSGIGRQTALTLLRNDFKVILAGRTLKRLEETQRLAADQSAIAYPIVVDVTNPTSVQQLFSK